MITTMSLTERNKFFAMYRSALRRLAPNGIFYGVIMALCFPLIYIVQRVTLLAHNEVYYQSANAFSGVHNGITSSCLILLCTVAPILFGVLTFSYLHNRRATDVYHAMPLRRDGMFAAHYLAGLTLLWVPLVLCFGVVLATAGVMGSSKGYPFLPGPILQELLCWMVVTATVYTITCLVAVLSGTSFDTVLFSLAFNGMWPVLLLICNLQLDSLLVGYWGWPDAGIFSLAGVTILSPFSVIAYRLYMQPAARSVIEQMEHDNSFRIHQIGMWVWAVITLVLLALAIWLYRRRPSEQAGRSSSSSVLGRVVQFATAFVVGSFCGTLLGSVVFFSTGATILFTLLGGILAFTVLEVVFGRGFKTFPRAFLPMGIAGALPTILCAVLLLGGFGYVDRIPTTDQITSVDLTYMGRYGMRYSYETGLSEEGDSVKSTMHEWVTITDPAGIEAAQEIHRASLEDGKRTKFQQYPDDYVSASFMPRIRYKLRNGTTIERYYNRASTESVQAIEVIENLEEFKRQTSPAFLFTPESLLAVAVTNRLGQETDLQMFTTEQKTRLLEALRQDVLTETVEDLRSGAYAQHGYLHLFTDENARQKGQILPDQTYLLITDQFVNTLPVLRELGLDRMMETDPKSVTKALIQCTGRNGYYGIYGDQGSLYSICWPDTDRLIGNEWKYMSYDSEWIEVDESLIPSLLEAASSVSSPGSIKWNVYFENGALEGMALYVPEEAIPENVRQEYFATFPHKGYDLYASQAAASEALTTGVDSDTAATQVTIG